MKELTIALASLLVVYAHSRTKTASIPCSSDTGKIKSKNLLYEWIYYEPTVVVPNQKLSVLPNGTLLINDFTKGDHGQYVCQVKDGDTIIDRVSVDVNDEHGAGTEEAQRRPGTLEQCPSYSCIGPDKCANPDTNRICQDGNDVCCPLMREEDRHRCQHFLGECMSHCHVNVRVTRADDCPENTMCCVLV